jgi:hypothetical protein
MKKLLICFFSIICIPVFAQVNIKDSALFAPILMVHYAYEFPGADLNNLYGNNSNIGGDFVIKTKKNFLFGISGSFLFGEKVKNQEVILKNISTSAGYVIDGNGAYAEIYMYERGYLLTGNFGKIFPIRKINPNSGIVIMAGLGFLEHHIRIENPGKVAPQVNGDYKKGYDKLRNGIAISQFIGYWNMSNNRLFNFYIGFESVQAWTRSRRDFDFSLGGKDNQKYTDVFYGIKIGWMIPFYKRSPDKYYYY